MEKHDEVLVALRQIIRAIDMHSRRLIKEAGLTSPQLLLLKGIDELGQISMRQLADHTNMSQATATTIMDRLESRQLVQRVRSNTDKRKVHATLTDAGRALLAQAPTRCRRASSSASRPWRTGNRDCCSPPCNGSRP